MDRGPLRPPTLGNVVGEVLVVGDAARLLLRLPALARQPRGEGRPVLVLPGLGGSNASTAVLRAYLRYLGHDARGWSLGRNGGDVAALLPRVVAEVERLSSETSRKVSLIGWSLGGVLAREAARRSERAVERVVTLGTPVVGGPKYTAVAGAYRRRGYDLDAVEQAVESHERVPIAVPVTAVFSRADGIVSWRACIDRRNPGVEHVEVPARHLGLGISPEVLVVIAGKLASTPVLSPTS